MDGIHGNCTGGPLKILLPLKAGPFFHQGGHLGAPQIVLPLEPGPLFRPRGHKITPRDAKIVPRGSKKASRQAKMTISMHKTDFAKNIEKPKENQRFWLLQPTQNRPKIAPSPAKMTEDRSKMAPRPAKTTP